MLDEEDSLSAPHFLHLQAGPRMVRVVFVDLLVCLVGVTWLLYQVQQYTSQRYDRFSSARTGGNIRCRNVSSQVLILNSGLSLSLKEHFHSHPNQ